MGGFLYFLIFALLFYAMMRFGCGAHTVHGRHERGGGAGGDRAGNEKHLDPVCARHVDPQEGYAKMHAGKLYRFCSRRCLDAFEAEPARYPTGRKEATS